MTSSGVGRILSDSERAERMADEDAAGLSGEGLRSAFVISPEHVLTAWHCVRDAAGPLWFRLRVASGNASNRYRYLPVRVQRQDQAFDVAVLAVDEARLDAAALTEREVTALLAGAVIPLGVDVSVHDQVRVMGFPVSTPSADSDTLPAKVVDLCLPLGEVTGLKLVGESFAAVDPVNPRGLSGGPVLRPVIARDGNQGTEVAVGVVRDVPVGRYADTALGGGLIATRIEDVAGRLPEVAAALLTDVTDASFQAVPWAGRPLSALIQADAGLVGFLGRDRERQDLHAWCDGPAERAAWLLTGPGGQGKTRLARQLCAELTGSGTWAAAILRGPGDMPAVRDLCWRAAAAGRPLLLVADYAAEYGAAAFAELIALLTAAPPSRMPRWRLLLLARNAGDWWEPQASGAGPGTAMRQQLTAHGVEVPRNELALPPLVPDFRARGEIFQRIVAQLRPAVSAFALAHGIAVTDPPGVPDLSGDDLGSALMLHVAAIVSLLPSAGTPLNPADRPSSGDLMNRILDLECEQHWLYQDAAAARLYRPVEESFGDLARGDSTAVEIAVATATLAGAPTAYAAGQLIMRALEVDQAQARKIAHWLHDLYPAPVAGPGTWLPPLQPDRLGEELTARVIRRQQADGVPADQLLPHRILGSLAPGQVHRLLTVMFRSGARDRDIAGLLAGGDGHGGLLGEIPAETDLSVVEAALPKMNTNLLGASAAVTAHTLRHYDSAHPQWRTLDTGEEAAQPVLAAGTRILAQLALRLSEAGRRVDALLPGSEAVSLFRRLADASPASYLPDYAHVLDNYGNQLSDVGRPGEALRAATEAAAYYEFLARTDPAAYLPEYAMALNNLGTRLAEAGQPGEAVAPASQAVESYRYLIDIAPAGYQADIVRAAYLPDLASSLNNLSITLARAGQQEEALAAAREAVQTWRPLASINPAAYRPNLALALNTLGVRLASMKRHDEALGPGREALQIRQLLAEANPAAYLPDLSTSLNNLGNWLFLTGKGEEALANAEQASQVCLGLAQADPVYLPRLATTLTNLGNQLAAAGRHSEASDAWQEAFTRLGPWAAELRRLQAPQ